MSRPPAWLIPLLFAGACSTGPAAARSADAPPLVPYRAIQLCVVQGGALTLVTARQHPVTGDTTFGTPDWPTPPAGWEYAAERAWFTGNESIVVMGHRYVKYGPERVLEVGDVTRVAEYDSVPVFVEAGLWPASAEFIFVPVRPGCVFQPYNGSIDVRRDDRAAPARAKRGRGR